MSTTATKSAVKSAAAKAAVVKTEVEASKVKAAPKGRANQQATFQQAAEAKSWKIAKVSSANQDPSGFKYAKQVGGVPGDVLAATKDGVTITVYCFTGRSGQAGRMSAGYITKDGATRNLGVVYQIFNALDSGAPTGKDETRKRGTKAEQAERSEVKADAPAVKAEVKPAPAKKAAAPKKAAAASKDVTPVLKGAKK